MATKKAKPVNEINNSEVENEESPVKASNVFNANQEAKAKARAEFEQEFDCSLTDFFNGLGMYAYEADEVPAADIVGTLKVLTAKLRSFKAEGVNTLEGYKKALISEDVKHTHREVDVDVIRALAAEQGIDVEDIEYLGKKDGAQIFQATAKNMTKKIRLFKTTRFPRTWKLIGETYESIADARTARDTLIAGSADSDFELDESNFMIVGEIG